MGNVISDLVMLRENTVSSAVVNIPKSTNQTVMLKYLVGTIIVLILAMAGSLWYNFSGKTDSVQTPLEIVPLTRYSGNEILPSFSPDGNQVAFAWDGPNKDNYDIYLKVAGTESISRLTKDPEYEFHPSWSPDGRTIAYKKYHSQDTYSVNLMSSLGGSVRNLVDMTETTTFFIKWMTSLAWHPSGEFLVISRQSGEINRLTNPPSDVSHGDAKAVFSKDGQKLVFVRIVAEGISDLYLLELSESCEALGEPQRITFQEILHRGAVFLPGNDEIVYSAGSSLWRLSLSENGEPKLIMQVEGLTEIAISHQGDKLAYAKERYSANIMSVDISEKRTTNKRTKILIPSTVEDLSPSYSPDGQRIAFFSTRSGHGEVWVCDANGSNLLQLTHYGTWTGGPSWSPDGKFLAIDTRVDGQADIYVIPSNGGPHRRITNNPAQDHFPCWSKDGKWIYFNSNRTGQAEIWKVSIDGKEESQLTQNGGWAPKESPDGQMVYFNKGQSTDNMDLWSVAPNGGNETEILEGCYLSTFEIAEDGIYFMSSVDFENKFVIQYLNFETDETQIIHDLKDNPCSIGLSVSPKQKSLLYIKRSDLGSDIDIIENFR
jgi:Tol biopolymer transport system component